MPLLRPILLLLLMLLLMLLSALAATSGKSRPLDGRWCLTSLLEHLIEDDSAEARYHALLAHNSLHH